MHSLAKKHFEKIKKSDKILGQNKSCKYFSCHDKIEDCTWCYCPLYPCENLSRGGYWLENKKTREKIWACEKCSWTHQKDVSKKIFKKYFNR